VIRLTLINPSQHPPEGILPSPACHHAATRRIITHSTVTNAATRRIITHSTGTKVLALLRISVYSNLLETI